MIIITMSTFLSIIVLNLYIRGDRRNQVPLWLRRVIASLQLTADDAYTSHDKYHDIIVLCAELDDHCDKLLRSSVGARRYCQLN